MSQYLILTILLSLGKTFLADEAVVIIGGTYPDGYADNEVEVWSPSPDCPLEVPSTPDAFIDTPGAEFYQDSLYVCGGHRIGTTHTRDTCDVYNFAEKDWSQGSPLKTNSSHLSLARVGSNLAAVYSNEDDHFRLVVSFLEDSGWVESFPLDAEAPDGGELHLVVLDDEHLAIQVPWNTNNPNPYEERLFIVDTETGKLSNLTINFRCEKPFMFNNLLTCVRGNLFEDRELVALSFDDAEFSNPTWSVVGTIPTEIWDAQHTYYESRAVVVLDGLLAVVMSDFGAIFYLEEGDWKTVGLDISRFEPAVFVMNCNLS